MVQKTFLAISIVICLVDAVTASQFGHLHFSKDTVYETYGTHRNQIPDTVEVYNQRAVFTVIDSIKILVDTLKFPKYAVAFQEMPVYKDHHYGNNACPLYKQDKIKIPANSSIYLVNFEIGCHRCFFPTGRLLRIKKDNLPDMVMKINFYSQIRSDVSNQAEYSVNTLVIIGKGDKCAE